MIKEYSVDFNKLTMDFKCYNNFVGDKSQSFRTVGFKARIKSTRDHINHFTNEFKRQMDIYEANIEGWEVHEMIIEVGENNKVKLKEAQLVGAKLFD